jgi:Mrp family chromosome partitioning ATPase
VTLADLAAALRRFRLLAIGLFVATILIGLGAALLPAERYRTSAVVSVEPISQSVGFETQQAIQLTIPPTIARMVSPTFEQSVRARMLPGTRNAPLAIKAVHEPGTAIIDMTVESSTPRNAVDAAQVAAQRLVQEPRSDRFRVNVVSPPGSASSVRDSRTPPLLIGSLVLGLILAVLAAAALHRLLPRIPRGAHFRERYGHDVLSEIPQTRHGTKQLSRGLLEGDAPGELREAFRILEARVAQRVAERSTSDDAMSIVVTSWSKGEGKTTVAAHLACALAAGRRRVTVIDSDLRRPRIHALLDCSLEPGLSDIADGKPVGSVLQSTPLEALDVVAAGHGPPGRHPAEIAHDAIALVLSVLGDRIVLIDAAPLFTAETTAIVGEADAVLLVADHRRRRPADIDAALAEIELTGTPLLGVVLNRVTDADTRGRESYLYAPAAAKRAVKAPPPAETPPPEAKKPPPGNALGPAKVRARQAKRRV